MQQGLNILKKIASGGESDVFLVNAGGKPKIKPLVLKLYKDFAIKLGSSEIEKNILANLKHENFIKSFDQISYKSRLGILLEYVNGPTLTQLIEIMSSCSIFDCLLIQSYIAKEILKAISYLHNNSNKYYFPFGIIHGDLNPNNIILNKRGDIKIIDFSSSITNPNENNGFIFGNGEFMATERFYGNRVTKSADLYSFGAIMYRMATQERFNHENYTRAFKIFRKKISSTHQALYYAVTFCLSPSAFLRPSGAAEILEAIWDLDYGEGKIKLSRLLRKIER